MSEDLKRAAYCRQKLEDVKAHLHDIITALTADEGRLKVFESMLMGRVEAITDSVSGSIERIRQFEEFRRKKEDKPSPPNVVSK